MTLIVGIDGGVRAGLAFIRPRPPSAVAGPPYELLEAVTIANGTETRAEQLRRHLARHAEPEGSGFPRVFGGVEGAAWYGGSPGRARGLWHAAAWSGYYQGALEAMLVSVVTPTAPEVRKVLGVGGGSSKGALWSMAKVWVGATDIGRNEHQRDAVAVAIAAAKAWENVLAGR